VLTVLWRRRTERRAIAAYAHERATSSSLRPGRHRTCFPYLHSPTRTTYRRILLSISALTPPLLRPPKPQPVAPAEPTRRPSFRERFRSSFPGPRGPAERQLARERARSRVDPVLPRTHIHYSGGSIFNSRRYASTATSASALGAAASVQRLPRRRLSRSRRHDTYVARLYAISAYLHQHHT
jgi:hypothetical protein